MAVVMRRETGCGDAGGAGGGGGGVGGGGGGGIFMMLLLRSCLDLISKVSTHTHKSGQPPPLQVKCVLQKGVCASNLVRWWGLRNMLASCGTNLRQVILSHCLCLIHIARRGQQLL